MATHTNGEVNSPVISHSNDDTAITVLVVDDDPDLLDLTATFLEREEDDFEVLSESDPTAAIDRVNDTDLDAIVSDYDMPTLNGLEFLAAIREDHDSIPFILFTGKGSEEIASEAISKGVTDYLEKKTGPEQYSLLANRICNAVEQYHSAEALKQSEEKFSKLVKNSTDVLGIVDQKGQFKYISPACEHTLGYNQSELIGECAFDYMPPDDRHEAMDEFFAAIEDPEKEPIIEFRFEDPDGGWTIVEARGKNLFDDEFINGFVVNARDITELKKREQELKQQNERLRNMRKVMSHDLQNPVGVAADSLVLYRDSGEDKWLDKVETAVSRIDELLNKVTALSTDQTNITDTQTVELRDIVSSAWETVDTSGAQLHIQDSKAFEADPSRLKQVFENLLRNAVEHSDSEILIEVGTTDDGLYFEDTGPGIPEDERDEVFQSGYTTAPEKTGFGLNIVKEIVIGHGWEITIREGDEGGARFEIDGIVFQPAVYN
ncbi:PAS domain S-box protein [Haloarcula amylovorans]|uniref:PAS domain S-box protein n=1 Tax=Haloarcula amylovorans TaxID=2562280 RepID=UPI00107627CD|nr:PAS domain S-box protein [Halomicroarcula amylolytica]